MRSNQLSCCLNVCGQGAVWADPILETSVLPLPTLIIVLSHGSQRGSLVTRIQQGYAYWAEIAVR